MKSSVNQGSVNQGKIKTILLDDSTFGDMETNTTCVLSVLSAFYVHELYCKIEFLSQPVLSSNALLYGVTSPVTHYYLPEVTL